MIFIVVEEVIPESQKGGNTDLATMGLIAGFIVMMMLDVGLVNLPLTTKSFK
jgi:ZIP family zinc transporter